MKACFCSKHGTGRIPYVFSGGRREEIAKRVTLLDQVICKENLETCREETKDVGIIVGTWGMETFSREQISTYFPNLELVLYAAGSVQRFARPFLELGIPVVNASAAMATHVAQFTLSLVIQLSKGFFLARDCFRDHGFRAGRDLSTLSFPGLYDKTPVGILGAGMIGRKVIGYLKDFDVDILVYDPFLPDEEATRLGVRKTSLEEIFATCQVISNHIANNSQTVGILDYRLFSTMKKNGALINTGRGAQVVEADLARAMREEPMRCAVLDVTDPEPYPSDGPFWDIPNIVLLPHIAGFAASEVHCLSDAAIGQLDRFLRHEPLEHVVTLEMLETMA
jgi:phosphoglycerate dehydrogenase-like enzyme